MARLKGLFGGVFAVESFVLSQSYYYGTNASNSEREHRVEVVDGTPIDLLDELDEIAIGKPSGRAEGSVDRDLSHKRTSQPNPPPRCRAARASGPTVNGLVGVLRRLYAAVLRRLHAAVPKERNHILFWAGCRFAEAVAAGLIDRASARALLHQGGIAVGLGESEIAKTIASSFQRGT